MPSTPAVKETDPHDIFVIEPDVVLAARADPISAMLASDAVSPPSAAAAEPEKFAGTSAPSVDTTFRAAVNGKANVPAGSSMGRHVRRAGVICLLALCSAAAGVGWKHYGHTARAMAAHWVPALALTSEPSDQKSDAGPPALPNQQAAATEQATVQPVATAQPAPNTGATVATVPPETAQLLQSMSQQIAELRASVEQLKAGQAQMSREMARTAEARPSDKPVPARAAEPGLRPKLPPPLHSKPKPAYAPVQASVAPPLPPPTSAPVAMQPRSLPPPPPEYADPSEYEPVVRPPMPLR
jgi:hypothetical protein